MGLRTIRQQRGLTQIELAKLADLEQSQVSALERASDPNVGWHTLRRLARALKARPEELFSLRPGGWR